MSIRDPACVLMALALLSCQPTAETRPSAPQRPQKGDDAQGTITVEMADGKPVSPEEEQALAAFAKHLLTEAVTKALKEGMEELYQKLKISDEVEKRLLAVPYGEGEDRETDTWSVYVMRPSKDTLPPETIEVAKDGKPFLRFTRVFTKVETPVAIMTLRRMTGGKPEQSELILVYDSKAGWQPHRPTVKKESLQSGKP